MTDYAITIICITVIVVVAIFSYAFWASTKNVNYESDRNRQ